MQLPTVAGGTQGLGSSSIKYYASKGSQARTTYLPTLTCVYCDKGWSEASVAVGLFCIIVII
jgi:hypothetical protein